MNAMLNGSSFGALAPLLPRGWRRRVRRLGRRRKALLTDERLSDSRYFLKSELSQDACIVADRTGLLELLPKGGTMVEIGVAHGDFAELILKAARPDRLYLIDHWNDPNPRYEGCWQRVNERFAHEIAQEKVVPIRATSVEAIGHLPDGAVDFAYLDAGHDFSSVATDLAALEPKIAPDGLIGGHDYTRWGEKGAERWGVVEAVNDFCNRRNWRLVALTNEPHRHLSYLLKR